MDLVSSINPKNILVNINAKSKDDVLRKIIHTFSQTNNIENEDEYLKAVYDREAEGVTGIGNAVAIPHGKSRTVIEPGVGIAVLDEPVEWESLDDQKVKIVVLFAVTDSVAGAQDHLKLLSQFAKKLGNDEVLDKLKDSKSVDDVIDAFEN